MKVFLMATLILSLELIWADESILAKWDKETKNEDTRDGMSPDFEPKSSLSFNIEARAMSYLLEQTWVETEPELYKLS